MHPVQGIWKSTYLMIGGMTIEGQGTQEVLVGITIHLEIQYRRAPAFSESESSPSRSPIRHQRRRLELDSLQGELRRLKPPTFDGEHRRVNKLKLGCWA
jgi:hypothetical protein